MPDPAAVPAFQSSRPSVEVDGRDEPALADGMLNLVVEEGREGLSRCEATVGNWGMKNGDVTYLYLDRRLLDFGKPVSVAAGEGDAEAVIFEGRITGLEAQYPRERPPELTLLAEDRLQDLRMTRRTRTFEDVSDGDVIREIASDHGLRPEIDVDGGDHRVVAQVNQSDLAFLRSLARRLDAEVFVAGDRLVVGARSRLERTSVTLEYGRRLQAFSVLADVARQRTSLTVAGWDSDAKEGVAAEADASVLLPDLNGGESGAAILERAFDRRAEPIVHTVPFSQEEARRAAEAHFRAVGRRFLTGRGVCEGDGRIRVGTVLTLEGLGGLFDGAYSVTEARHTFESRTGYRTRFVVERAGLGSS